MPLLEGIVCNKEAHLDGYWGTTGAVDDTIYKFYFLESEEDECKFNKVKQAFIVTQTGGCGTGLFKIPLVGERVLVIQDGSGSNYYLLGYLPSKEEMPVVADSESDKFNKLGGQVRRYWHSGESSSEISFYSQKDTGLGSDNADMINMESSGSTMIRAGERLYQRAETLQIKIGGSELDVKFDKENPETHPIGDRPGESPSNGKGDIDMRAANNIVIKAAKSIKLQVGRTILTIKDSGFEVVTKKTNSNWPLGIIDTKFSMKPRTGISMYGNNVAIEANGSASMKDAWGGSVSLSTGVASLTGRETSVNGMAGVAYKWIILKNLVEIQYNAIMGFAYSMTNKDPNSMLTGESAQIIVNAVKKFLGYFEQIDSLQSARKIMVNREVIQPALKALKEAREALERAHDPSGRTLKEQEQAALDAIDNEATLSDDERKALKEEIKNDYKAMSASFANTLSDNEINDYNALYDQHFSKYQGAFWLKDQFTLFGEQIFQGPNLSAYRNAKMVRTPTP